MRTTSRPLLLVLVITIAASSLPAYGQPGVSLSPPTLSFATQTIGTQSAFQPIMLTNTGNSTLRISSVLVGGSFNGDFLQSSNCIGSLNAGSHCEIKVIFAPTGTGSRTASVLVFDDASNSPQSAALSGPGLVRSQTSAVRHTNFLTPELRPTRPASMFTRTRIPGSITAFHRGSLVTSGRSPLTQAASTTPPTWPLAASCPATRCITT